jgi:hypothetical protein
MTFQTPKTVKSKVIAPAFVSGSHTNISFTYDANNQVINASGSLGGGGGGSSEGRIVNNVINTFPYTISTPSSSVTTLKYLIDNGSSDVVVNLPTAASTNTDLRIEIKRRGTGNVTVNPVSTPSQQYIDGLTSILISSQYANLVIDSDGTGWNIK